MTATVTTWPGLNVAQFGPRATIDGSRWQMEQNIDDARRFAVEQPRINLFQLRPDTGQAGERRKQRVEHKRPHGMIITKIFSVMLGLAAAFHALQPPKCRGWIPADVVSWPT